MFFLPLAVSYVIAALVGHRFVEEGDEQNYLWFAERLTHGAYADHDAVTDVRYLWYGPGLPVLLAPLAAIHVPVAGLRLAGAALMFGAVVAFHELARSYVQPRSALIATYGFGLYLPFLVTLARVLSEPLAVLATVTGLLFGTRYFRGGRKVDLAFAGLALGWLALTKVAFGYIFTALLALAAGWAVIQRTASAPRRAAVLPAAALLVCLPWLVYTHSVTGKPFYWGNSGSHNLYWISSPLSGSHGDGPDLDSMPRQDRAFFASLEPLPPLEREEEIRNRALENIRERPDAYVGNVAANVARMLVDAPHSYGTGHGLRVLLYAAPNAILLALLAYALPSLRRERRRRAELSVLLAFAGVTVLFHVLLSAEPRLLAPVIPVAILLAAWGLEARSMGTPWNASVTCERGSAPHSTCRGSMHAVDSTDWRG